jgi:two-component system phosphate regulon response regulator PhoB
LANYLAPSAIPARRHAGEEQTMKDILVVEDEAAIRQLLVFILRQAGYGAREAGNAAEAGDEVNRRLPDLALLDWQLPDMDGLRLLKSWRTEETTLGLPVIMVSARITEADRVAGLRAGADDYVIKPFARDELLARVDAVLRRAGARPGQVPEVREARGLTLDVRSLRVTAGKKAVLLGPIEFRLLNLFMSQPERALSRTQIVDRVWRANAYVDERTVDAHVRRLRAALEPSGHDGLIQTVRGVGYRFSAAEVGGPVPAPSTAPDRDAGQRMDRSPV